jgi:DNA-binding response OmpR family regulator
VPLSTVPPQRRKRILVVEDEARTGAMYAKLLQERWDVELAGDGLAALAIVQVRPPDLLLTDVNMPRMDGYTLARRAHELRPGLPIIMVTGRDRPLDLVAGINAGARHYITKPVDVVELTAKIRRALGE